MPKKAFIIGAKTKKLNYTDNDLKLLSEALKFHDYEIISPKGKKSEVLEEFEQICKNCKQGDTLLFYFSGHGTIDGGKLYLEYYNDSKIGISQIFDEIHICPAGSKIVILDTCNSGNAAVDWTPKIDEERYCLITATRRLKPAKEYDKYEASFLAYYINKALTDKENYPVDEQNRITVRTLLTYLEKVAEKHNNTDLEKVETPIKHDNTNFEIAKISGSFQRKESKREFLNRLQEQLKNKEEELSKIESDLKESKKQGNTSEIERLEKLQNNALTEIKRIRTEIAYTNQDLYEKKVEIKSDIYSEIPICLKEKSNIDPPNQNFVGRKDKIIQILERVLDNENIAVTGVKGMGGVGKTAIVTEICNYFKNSWSENPKYPEFVKDILGNKKYFTDGFLWIRFEREETISFVLENIYSQIGVKIISDDIEERLKALNSILKHKDVLIILDSAEQNKDNFKTLFRAFKNLPIIVTSRIEFPNIDTINVNQLEKQEAYDLFLKHFKKDVDKLQQQQIETLCKDVGYLPIAIIILASKARIYKKNIVQLIEEFGRSKSEMKDKSILEYLNLKTELTENEKEEIRKNQDAILCFKLSFDDLEQIHKEVFMRCGLFFFSFPKHFIDRQFENQNIDNELDELIRLSLIEFDENTQRYTLHPLLREFAILNARETGIIDAMHLYKRDMFLSEDLNNLSEDDISDMFKEIEYCYENKDKASVIQFAEKFNMPLYYRGLWIKNIQLIEWTLNCVSDNNEKAKWLKELADRIGRQHNYEKSIELFEKSLQLKLDWFCNYFINSNYRSIENYTISYYLNLKHSRNSYLDSYEPNTTFTRTLGWLYNDYYYLAKEQNCKLVAFKQEMFNLSKSISSMSDFLKIYADLIDFTHNRKVNDNLLRYISVLYAYSLKNCIYEMVESYESWLLEYFINIEDSINAENQIVKYKNACLNMGIIDIISELSNYQGRICLLKQDLEEAIRQFNQISKVQYKNYWLGKTYLRMNDLVNAEKHLQLALNYWQEKQNAVKIATIYAELSQIFIHKNQALQAAEKLALAVNTKKKFGIENLKDELYAIEQFETRFGQGSFEQFQNQFYKDKYIDIVPDFIIRNLPLKIFSNNKADNNKEMLLIPEGNCFVTNNGVDDIIIFDIDFILENIDDFWNGRYTNLPHANEMYLYPYYIDKQPVTNAEYKRFCLATKHPEPSHWNENFDITEQALQPVTGISYQDAEKYANFVNKELPTEAEWEKAFWSANYPFYEYETPINLSPEKDLMLKTITSENLIKGNDKDIILKALVGEKLYNFLSQNKQIIEKWNTIDKQPIFDIAEITGNFDNSIYYPLMPEISESIKTKFNWKMLFNLICYSLTNTGFQKKQKILERLPKLNESQIRKLFEILINEVIEYYRLIDKTTSITAQYLSEKNFWLIAVKSFIGLQSEFEIEKPQQTEFVAKNKIKFFHQTKVREIIRTEETKPDEIKSDVVFRCVKPIFSNQDFESFKIINKTV